MKPTIEINGVKFPIKRVLTAAQRIREAKRTGILRMGEGRKTKKGGDLLVEPHRTLKEAGKISNLCNKAGRGRDLLKRR